MAKRWIKDVVSKHPGVFSAKAEKAGKSTAEFAEEKSDAPGKVGRQARLAQTLMSLHKGRSDKAKSRMGKMYKD